MEIKGQAAIVTGGASGLGAATARALAAAGAKVAILDVNEKAAAEVADRHQRHRGHLRRRRQLPAPKPRSRRPPPIMARRASWSIAPASGRPSASSAATGRCRSPITSASSSINLIGTFNMMRLVAAAMQPLAAFADGERGVIVSTASVAAFEGQIGQAAYSSSKGGVAALTLPAAREFAQFGVRVLAIAPGIFGTPMLRALPQEAQDSLGASVPFPKRLGEPREFAALVLHCIHNGYLNGEVIRLDGALRMAPR